MNANVVDPAPGEALGPESMRYFVLQRVSAATFDGTPDEVRHRLGCAFRRGEHDKVLWTFVSGGSCNAGAAVVNGTVYWGSGYSVWGVGTTNNKLYAFTVP